MHRHKIEFNRIKIELRGAEMAPELKFFEFVKRYLTEMLADTETFEIYLAYWNINPNFVALYEEDRSDFLQFVQEIFDNMNVRSDPAVFRSDAPVIMVLTSLNLTPRLLADKQNPDVEAVVNDFLSRLTGGFHAEKKIFNQ